MINEVKQIKYNTFTRIWRAIVDFFASLIGVTYSKDFAEEVQNTVYGFVNKHATFRSIERHYHLLKQDKQETWKQRQDDYAEDADLKSFTAKAKILTPLQELNIKIVRFVLPC